MKTEHLTPGSTLASALRQLHPGLLPGMKGKVSAEVLAALAEGATALVPMFEALSALSGACSLGNVEGAADALRCMPAAVATAEAAFLRTCEKHGVPPEAVVDSLSYTRQLLQAIAGGAPIRQPV